MRGLLAITTVALALSVTPAAADPPPTPTLPKPTGKHPVGATALYLKDTSRPDTWVPSVPYRELMVSLFYPAVSAPGPKWQYMTPAESAALIADSGLSGVPGDVLTTTVTNAVRDARPAASRPHNLPLLVLSPGYTKVRGTLTALAEDLASHGYVVAVVDHTYENLAMSLPGGRVAECVSCDIQPHDDVFFEKLERGRAADVSFVLDQLTGRHPKWRHANLIDESRIGMTGHSIGGASSIAAMVTDSRIRAGINIDGNTHFPIPDPGLSRPFMFLGHQLTPIRCEAGVNDRWERDFARMTGWKRWLEVAGAAHASFTDVGLLGDQWGIDFGATVPSARVQAMTRAYVRAFFDEHLRGRHQALLDGPSTRYPEVSFCR